jgi:transposase
MERKKKHLVYQEEFRRQAVEMVIHSGKTQAQVARELGCSEYSLNLWKKAYLRQQAPAEIDGQSRSPEQMLAEIRRLQKENEYLKRQREILKRSLLPCFRRVRGMISKDTCLHFTLRCRNQIFGGIF